MKEYYCSNTKTIEKNYCNTIYKSSMDVLYISEDNQISSIREKIKKIDWDKISDNWTIKFHNVEMQLDPYSDCSKDNPLYMHRGWLKRVYNNKELNLSDRLIGKIFGINHKTIGGWRETFKIPTKERKERYNSGEGYVILLMPSDYKHPQITSSSSSAGRLRRKEHIVIMEKYLSQHPENKLFNECLIDGKYLNIECHVHHINHIRNDNRLENLWLYRNDSEHSSSQRSLNDCFRGLINLSQIYFKNGKYHLNEIFDYKRLDSSIIEKALENVKVETFEDMDSIKNELKRIDWQKISDNWTIEYQTNWNAPIKTLQLNPYLDCSKDNPLYKNKLWVETLVKDQRFNLTDSRLAELCGISESNMYKWRWDKHKIPTYDERWGKYRIIMKNSIGEYRVWIKVPDDYGNPFVQKKVRHDMMLEHRFVMEQYLSQHPELNHFKDSLLNGKYLKSNCIVHHINLDTIDNRLENLWLCRSNEEHNSVHSSLLKLVDSLLKLGFLVFREGVYYLSF